MTASVVTRGPGDDAPVGDRLRRGRAQGRPLAEDHVPHHRAERHRGDPGPEGRRHRAPRLRRTSTRSSPRPRPTGSTRRPSSTRQKSLFDQGLRPEVRARRGRRAARRATRARVRLRPRRCSTTRSSARRSPASSRPSAPSSARRSRRSAPRPRAAARAARSRRSSSSPRSTSAPTSTRRTSRSSRKNQPAEITLDAVPDKTYHGWLRQIVPAADRQKATVRVKVAFLDADDRVLPDLSARVGVHVGADAGQREPQPRVVDPEGGARRRWTASRASSGSSTAGRSSRRSTAGGDVQGQVEVTQGLQGGERLISLAGGDAAARTATGFESKAGEVSMSRAADSTSSTSRRSTAGTRSRSRS